MAASSVSPIQAPASARAISGARIGATAGPLIGLATLSAIQAWEWLFSGLAKLQNDAFVRGFVAFVSHAPGPYGRFMASVVSTAPGLVPRVVEATELGLGITLLVAAVLVLGPVRRLRIPAIYAAGAASLIGAVTAINIAILAGDRAPWMLSTATFGTGVPVEALLAGISIAGVAEAYSAWRLARR